MKQYPSPSSLAAAIGGPVLASGPIVFWAPSKEFSSAHLYWLGALLLICALLFLHRLRRNRRVQAERNPLEHAPFIRTILQTAAEAQTPLDIVHADAAIPPLRGELTLEQGRRLRIDLHAGTLSPQWENAPVEVFFHFSDGPAQTFYQFDSTVLEVRPNYTLASLLLAFPPALTHEQRRGFVRITPGAGMVEGMTLWPYAAQSVDLPRTARALGRPDFIFRPPQRINLTLENISASGALVCLHAAPGAAALPTCQVGDKYVLLLLLETLKDGGSMALWLAGDCRRVDAANPTFTDVALQFSHWCAPTSLTAPIVWNPVECEGEVPPLLRWAGRAHVLLSRPFE